MASPRGLVRLWHRMTSPKADLEQDLLRAICRPQGSVQLQSFNYGNERIFGRSVDSHLAAAAAGQLLHKGYAYWDFIEHSAAHWTLRPTERGRAALASASQEFNPYDSHGYMRRLRDKVPGLDPVVHAYAAEALGAFESHLYLASTVMAGVGAEKAFLDVVTAFIPLLQTTARAELEAAMGKPNVVSKIEAFRKRLGTRPELLPPDVSEDDLSRLVNPIQDLIRVSRNEAGHPTGKTVEHDESHATLLLLAVYLQRLARLREHFLTSAGSAS